MGNVYVNSPIWDLITLFFVSIKSWIRAIGLVRLQFTTYYVYFCKYLS